MQDRRVLRAIVGASALVVCLPLFAGNAQAQVADIYSKWNPIVVTANARPVAPDLFGTVALPVKAERYYDGWERARRDASGVPSMQQLIAPARGLSRDQQIAYVQAAVNRTVRWMSDATEYGYHDYWASAAETLQHGAGDMEDRAILKMQALRTLGVPQRDLYVTMGRDKVGGPITVLIVRSGKRFYVLDDLGGAPIPSDRRQGFEPMVTLGFGGSWIHGHRIAGGTPAKVAAR